MKKEFFAFGLFVSEVISKISFWHFWLLVPDLGPTTRWNYFARVFNGNKARIWVF